MTQYVFTHMNAYNHVITCYLYNDGLVTDPKYVIVSGIIVHNQLNLCHFICMNVNDN